MNIYSLLLIKIGDVIVVLGLGNEVIMLFFVYICIHY